MTQNTRPRGKRIDVWVSESERDTIDNHAQSSKLSRSEFLRNLGLGYQPKSAFDPAAIRELVKLHTDQGRLGGLLKSWLAERNGEGANAIDVRSVLQQIESLQMKLIQIVMN